MKKIILIVVIVFSGMLMQAQKLIVNEIDSFTGNELKETSFAYFPPDFENNIGIAIRQVGIDYYLKLMLNGPIVVLEEGSKLMLKIKDGQVVTLYNRQYSEPQNPESTFGAKIIYANFVITKNEIELLKASDVDAVRIYFNDLEYLDIQIKEKHKKKLNKMFNLI